MADFQAIFAYTAQELTQTLSALSCPKIAVMVI